jgi:hypothetical protein
MEFDSPFNIALYIGFYDDAIKKVFSAGKQQARGAFYQGSAHRVEAAQRRSTQGDIENARHEQ